MLFYQHTLPLIFSLLAVLLTTGCASCRVPEIRLPTIAGTSERPPRTDQSVSETRAYALDVPRRPPYGVPSQLPVNEVIHHFTSGGSMNGGRARGVVIMHWLEREPHPSFEDVLDLLGATDYNAETDYFYKQNTHHDTYGIWRGVTHLPGEVTILDNERQTFNGQPVRLILAAHTYRIDDPKTFGERATAGQTIQRVYLHAFLVREGAIVLEAFQPTAAVLPQMAEGLALLDLFGENNLARWKIDPESDAYVGLHEFFDSHNLRLLPEDG
ncbi:hypothetical protein [Lewinella sp. IMCC34183]|uniref:hypothetical protein n=1 Tax=Lewinella sp. IMCC34183 TaxID=2248762 RepID=UPI000E26010D|nr:hypothetical protein [Lewinella sp. IMCC34183]